MEKETKKPVIFQENITQDLFTIRNKGYRYKLLLDGAMEILYTLQISKDVYKFIQKVNLKSYNQKNIDISSRNYHVGNYDLKCRYYIHIFDVVKSSPKFYEDIENKMYELKKTLMSVIRSNKIRLISKEMKDIKEGEWVK
ncbi:MAG: hypothetical protein GOVbin1709_45 [Prokaryotic dsDNA virus sp.]|nr:MAG: hypothetical protein GOVbin1709_45 [Prokaryotic dsDNA virus sp.]|tara:strand:+ start:2669 stop:3088 length:420 start_codon:yes stop_codon:yes gene_type:complete